MDTETSKALAKVLEYIVKSIGGVVNDKGTDTVEYLKTLSSEIVSYKLGIAYMWEIVAIMAAILGIILVIIGLVKNKEGCLWFGGISIAIALTIGIINGYTIIECNTFPEKVVLDYLEDLYNSGKIS